jgi:hypothetical protein
LPLATYGMSSALIGIANATAVFTVPTVGVVTDSATGNVTPATETVTVVLYLKRSTFTPNDLPGVDVDADVFAGYAVNPSAVDARVKRGIRGTLAWAGDASQPCVVSEIGSSFGATGLIGSTLKGVLGDELRVIRYRQR